MRVFYGYARSYISMTSDQLRDWIRARLATLRAGKKLDALAFAAAAGIDKSYVYRILNGKSSPTIETLNSWLQACDTTLPRFFEEMRTKEDIRALADEKRAQELLRLLPPKKRQAILLILESMSDESSTHSARAAPEG